jgi:hypothetical protein
VGEQAGSLEAALLQRLEVRPRSASWPRPAAGEGLVAMHPILPNAFTQIREDQ